MFPGLDANVVTQTLQACNYDMEEASNIAFALGQAILSDGVTLASWEHTKRFCDILAMACRPLHGLRLEAVPMVCVRLGNGTLADAPAAVCARFCGLGLPVGLGMHQQQRCLRFAAKHLLRAWVAKFLPAALLPAVQRRLHLSMLPPVFGCLSLTPNAAAGHGNVPCLCCSSLPCAVGSMPRCCLLQAVDRCLHFSNLQDTDAGAWAGEASSEADSSSAAGDYLSVSAASQGTTGWAQTGPELWPLDDSEKLKVRSIGCIAKCMAPGSLLVHLDAFCNSCPLLHKCCYLQSTWAAANPLGCQ